MERELNRNNEGLNRRRSKHSITTSFFITYINVSLGLPTDLCTVIWSGLGGRYRSECTERETFNHYKQYALNVSRMTMQQYNASVSKGYFKLMSGIPFGSSYECFTIWSDNKRNEIQYATSGSFLHRRDIWHEKLRRHLIIHSFLVNIRDYLHTELKHNRKWSYGWSPLEVKHLSQQHANGPENFRFTVGPPSIGIRNATVTCDLIFQQENGVTNGAIYHLYGKPLGRETLVNCDFTTVVRIIACQFHTAMCNYWISTLPSAHQIGLNELLGTSEVEKRVAALVEPYRKTKEAQHRDHSPKRT